VKLETMKTIAFDIKDSVFDNDTEAIMYITKDIYSDRYIIAIPVITFAWDIRMERPDYEWLLKSNIGIGDPGRKEKLVQVIKAAISEFE
jgi:hypothetical protein